MHSPLDFYASITFRSPQSTHFHSLFLGIMPPVDDEEEEQQEGDDDEDDDDDDEDDEDEDDEVELKDRCES